MGVFSKGCAVIREKKRLPKSHFFKLSPDPKTERFTQRLILGSSSLCGHRGLRQRMPLQSCTCPGKRPGGRRFGENCTSLFQYWCLYISCRKTGLLQGWLYLCLDQDPRSPASYCSWSACRLPVHSLPACIMLRLTCRSSNRWRRRQMIILRIIVCHFATV